MAQPGWLLLVMEMQPGVDGKSLCWTMQPLQSHQGRTIISNCHRGVVHLVLLLRFQKPLLDFLCSGSDAFSDCSGHLLRIDAWMRGLLLPDTAGLPSSQLRKPAPAHPDRKWRRHLQEQPCYSLL